MEFVDLRSDTVTKPTDAMREAMAIAEVGDDVYGEDPTVNHLQELAAGMMGKEAGLFVTSGTMGNLVGILSHCQRGDEVIVGKSNHVFLHEAGGVSVLGGVHSSQIPNQSDGSLALEDVEAAIRSDDPHEPVTRLVCLENTHNARGGVFQTPEYTRRAVQFAHERGLSVHLDGARIFNAAAAQGVSARELADPVDSVTFCLSKGLCAPVGSILCGSKEFIQKAHRLRKMVGGGMRQAGILAAAGIVALETMTARLEDDHTRARNLSAGLSQIPGLVLDFGVPATNMVFLSLSQEINLETNKIVGKLQEFGILVGLTGPRSFRLVLHYWVDDIGVERTIDAFRRAVI
jgi:threonine aldolase